jgi:hypothetical protein
VAARDRERPPRDARCSAGAGAGAAAGRRTAARQAVSATSPSAGDAGLIALVCEDAASKRSGGRCVSRRAWSGASRRWQSSSAQERPMRVLWRAGAGHRSHRAASRWRRRWMGEHDRCSRRLQPQQAEDVAADVPLGQPRPRSDARRRHDPWASHRPTTLARSRSSRASKPCGTPHWLRGYRGGLIPWQTSLGMIGAARPGPARALGKVITCTDSPAH